MAIKLEVTGATLYIKDTLDSDAIIDRVPISKDTWIDTNFDPIRINSEYTNFENKSYPLSDLVDTNDTPFTLETLNVFIDVNFKTASGGSEALNSEIPVKTSADFVLPINPDKVYVIDGTINMGTTEIEIPLGIKLRGVNMGVSKLISSANNYTMFKKDGANESGDFIATDLTFTISGTSSKLVDLKGVTGGEAWEISQVNFDNCTSLGLIDNYRQGFESATGRFGGTPTLELAGSWAGGYFIESSIVRGLDPLMNAPLFKAGLGFSMVSRFRSNQNIDLGDTASFVDFAPVNFPNPSTLDFNEMRITRNEVQNADDPNITPNITKGDLASFWTGNQGIPNTFVGGNTKVTTEVTTTINTVNTPEVLAGVFTETDLQHFDSPLDGQMRHLGVNPREYNVIGSFALDSGSNDVITLVLMKYDSSTTTDVEVSRLTGVINSLVGGRDVGFFTFIGNVTLDQNDYVYFMVENNTGTTDITAELDSFYNIQQR